MEQAQEQEKKAPVKKSVGNRTTEIIIGAAATKLQTGITALNSAVSEVEKLEERVQKSTLEVVNLEDKIGALQQDLINKAAQNKIEIEQQYNTDKASFAAKWAKENKMVFVVEDIYLNLKYDLENAQKSNEKMVEDAVKANTASLTAAHNNSLKIKELELQNKESANTAEIAQLKAQNKFLEDQIASMRKMLEDQQKNETERAKYGQIGTLNVGNANGSR